MFDDKAKLDAVRAFLKDGDNRGVNVPRRKPDPRGMRYIRQLLRERRAAKRR